MDTLDCPLCQNPFPQKDIEAHVNSCLDTGSDPTPPNIQNTAVVTVPPNLPPSETLPKDNTTTTTAMVEEDPSKLQEETYRFWIEKKKQEEEDMRLAMELEKDLSSPSTSTTTTAPTAIPKPSETVISDEELARKLMEEEQSHEKDEEDRRLAEELWLKEQQEEEERKRKNDWEDTLKLVKDQVKAEADKEIANALREREQLKMELERLKAEEKDNEKHVAVSLDGIEHPQAWAPQRSDYQTFQIIRGSEEWNEVTNHFISTLGGVKVTVKKLERIQNKTNWMFYFLQREKVAAKNNTNANEKFLFHGSRNNAYDMILKDGFDHRVSNLGGAIGAGIYFATHASTSMGYVGNSRGDKRMLYCRVTLGSVGPGQSGLRRPPNNPQGGIYDSVGQVNGGAGMYVVFDNSQAYPEYVITFN